MSKLTHEFKAKTVGYIVGALGLVAGLAWNEAIKGFIDYLYPLGKDSLPAKFIYAIAITIIVALLGWYMTREEEEKK